MNDRRYGTSRDVAVAEYLYRHEAELAAGFLRSAGVPFRLQVDDAGGADAGVTIARPAVLWVRAEDADEAREILELDGPAALSAVGPAPAAADRPDPRGRGAPAGAARGDAADPDTASPGAARASGGLEPLGRVERMIAGGLALVLVGVASAGGENAVPWVGVWEGAALLLALALGLSAVSGRTIGSLKTALRALSGSTL